MKAIGERTTAKGKKGAARTTATAARVRAEDVLRAGYAQLRGTPGKNAVKVKDVAVAKSKGQAQGVQRVGHVVDTHFLGTLRGSSVTAHDVVMKGVSGRALTRIWETTMGTLPTGAVLKAIGVSERTAHRIKSDPDKPLDARTTDGIYRLESVRALAEEVLGSAAAANEWLNTEAIGLEFRKPIDLLSSSPGAEGVKTLLQRMKYGVYA